MAGSWHLTKIEAVTIMSVLTIAGVICAPRFVGATQEEKICGLIDALQAIRSHIDLYRARHGGNIPPCHSCDAFGSALISEIGEAGHLRTVPVNPFNYSRTIRFDGRPAGAGRAGWRLDTKTGRLQADNNRACAAL
jgi:type II secretory pathway pseudopilin PulG